ncbi:hypothetical protein ACFR99_11525 [Haloarchaeobius amylolyticus]|uniref:MYXO-CTERM domain-containing protein n=1 Tax=Haloarchaeobius amylolyticus TaxID=1198296 RepID=A0ABD6BJ51_9EURY
MPETEQQDDTLSEFIVKEAVTRGMETPMRETILEAVEESEGARSGGRLPLAGILFGLGAAVGFLLGQQSPTLEETPLEDIEEPEIIEDVRSTTEETEETTEAMTDDTESDAPSRLSRLLLAVGVLAGAAILRRRLKSDEEEEWEPIEEFEPATDIEGETETDEEAELEAEEMDESDEE